MSVYNINICRYDINFGFLIRAYTLLFLQIENEYGNVMSSYGDAGKAYIDWCAKMADSQNIGVPWIMCQQPGPPEPMVCMHVISNSLIRVWDL